MENYKESQRAPIFLQWLDTVYQLMLLHPTAFEWNENLLITISEELFSCRFGTFLCDCVAKRREAKVYTKTLSLWPYLLERRRSFVNPTYESDPSVLSLDMNQVTLQLWSGYHLRWKPEEVRGLRVLELRGAASSTSSSSSSSAAVPKEREKEKRGWTTLASRFKPGGTRRKIQSMFVDPEDGKQKVVEVDEDEVEGVPAYQQQQSVPTSTSTSTSTSSGPSNTVGGADGEPPSALASSLDSTPTKKRRKRKTGGSSSSSSSPSAAPRSRSRAATTSIARPVKPNASTTSASDDEA